MLELLWKNGWNWAQLSSEERVATVVAVGGVLLILVFLVSLPFIARAGGVSGVGLGPLRRRFEGIRLHKSAEPGDVTFTYHTYRGILLWVIQAEHRVIAPAEDARRLLKRLLAYNLTWGMMSRGLLFVPWLAIANYLVQSRSIRRQIDAARRVKQTQAKKFDLDLEI